MLVTAQLSSKTLSDLRSIKRKPQKHNRLSKKMQDSEKSPEGRQPAHLQWESINAGFASKYLRSKKSHENGKKLTRSRQK